ncbi:Aste57867_15976 [Aphanomyces stellatus]|uniref:Aste57867_15976 protein n=1 Tax=Aphanomyces stellatus TaxID=120398 RepID=A0A485L4J3_9STRA|nr:hypothetical protein As57867_015920 [Aphanomyces stellatus]VFT92761.1 Aste57867_15976 [Aphanomyces stellatus]
MKIALIAFLGAALVSAQKNDPVSAKICTQALKKNVIESTVTNSQDFKTCWASLTKNAKFATVKLGDATNAILDAKSDTVPRLKEIKAALPSVPDCKTWYTKIVLPGITKYVNIKGEPCSFSYFDKYGKPTTAYSANTTWSFEDYLERASKIMGIDTALKPGEVLPITTKPRAPTTSKPKPSSSGKSVHLRTAHD